MKSGRNGTSRFICTLMAAVVAWSAFAMALHAPGRAFAAYRFDDISGSLGSGAQWVVVTEDGSTVGGASTRTMEFTANLVEARDSVYVLDGTQAPRAARAVLFVLPDSAAELDVALGQMNVSSDQIVLVPDIIADVGSYIVTKSELAPQGTKQTWRFGFFKTGDSGDTGNEGGVMIFQQKSADIPSQALQVPMIVAGVRGGTAADEPLLLRSTMRGAPAGSGTGAIVAHDRFTWNVTGDLQVGGGDWVFVPISAFPIDSNVVEYRLRTEITNYSGVRYALQRYDNTGYTELLPNRWAIDLPDSVSGIDPRIVLDDLSHIPPGLITTYEQGFNVVSGVQNILDIYPIDPAARHRRLNLSHPSVFGVELGRNAANDFDVTGFQLLASDADFLSKAAKTLGMKGVGMPKPEDGVMTNATSQGYVAGDAINTIAVNAAVPGYLASSGDVAGLLPLHVTMNMPRSNRLVAPKWDELMAEWRSTGAVRELFSRYFTVYARDYEERNLDLFDWLKTNSLFSDVVKVFMDEDNDRITISFIVMLMDSSSRALAALSDSTVTTNNKFLAMKDGHSDGMWDMTFFTAPVGYVESTPAGSSGGGGGCASGVAAASVAVLLPITAIVRRKRKTR